MFGLPVRAPSALITLVFLGVHGVYLPAHEAFACHDASDGGGGAHVHDSSDCLRLGPTVVESPCFDHDRPDPDHEEHTHPDASFQSASKKALVSPRTSPVLVGGVPFVDRAVSFTGRRALRSTCRVRAHGTRAPPVSD